MRPPDIIETPRLRLRPATVQDAPAIFTHYAQDPEVTKYLTWRPVERLAEVQDFLLLCEVRWNEGTAFAWVIERKDDGRLLGMVEIRLEKFRADLGYVLERASWGQGYMPEAVQSVVNWAMSRPEIFRVGAICDVENPASARVMEKAGMQREGVLRRWALHPNVSDEPRDFLCYAIVK